MGKIAFVFAGQGAQHPGMGQELAEISPAAAEVFQKLDALRPGTSAQCFSGTDEELKETKNTQPCMFAVELAAAAALTEAGIKADKAAGFSLGEIGALTYTGAVDLETGFHLVCRRGELMQAAAEEQPTAMAAVLKLPNEKVEELCGQFPETYPVNYNCPGQVSVACAKEQLAPFSAAVKAAGGRALPLKVRGGFHSPFMASAAEGFAQVLADCQVEEPKIPLCRVQRQRERAAGPADRLPRALGSHRPGYDCCGRGYVHRAGAGQHALRPDPEDRQDREDLSARHERRPGKGRAGGQGMRDFTGKVALVTGGSRGIGAAVVKQFASQGADVAVVYAGNQELAEALCAQCAADYGVKAIAYRCDVADFAAVKDTVNQVKKDFGSVDILVNNAGITQDGLLAMMKQEAFDRVLDVDLKGAFHFIRHCTGLFLRKKAGAIINVASVSGLIGNAGQANYSAAKAGLIGLTKAVAKELAPKGITCNAVAPGFVATDMTKDLEGQDNALLVAIPLGRMGQPEEVAEAVAFLAQSPYITGEVLRVDGGIAM